MNALVAWNEKQMALIRNTVARDCSAVEFDQFIHICKTVRLDPLRKQIYAFVMNKGNADKRQMTIVTSIVGYRVIAERTGSYRPGKTEIIFDETLKDKATNPLGISHATATVFKYVHGEWHEVSETAYWEEFSPQKEIWEDNKPTGRFHLDPKKDNWRRMPRVMIEKCAEAKALRRGWPDDFDGLYAEDEMDRAHSIDLTASEMADVGNQAKRLEAIGGKNAILIDWMDGEPLQRVPAGKFGDAAMAFIRAHMKPGEEEASAVIMWRDKNRHALVEYWALDKDGALTLKAELEKVEATLKAPAKQEAA